MLTTIEGYIATVRLNSHKCRVMCAMAHPLL